MVRAMGDHEAAVQDGEIGSAAVSERVRRPIPERTAPHRGWQHLYTLGTAADATAGSLPILPSREDDAARVVRDGYRTLEENLRRGRQAAEDLREVSSGSQSLGLSVAPQAWLTSFARAFFDPALTRPFVGLARTWMNALSWDRGAASAPPTLPPQSRVAFHPQQRPEYAGPAAARGGPQLLGLSVLRPGEWVGDLAIDGRVRRVQIRELEEL